MNNSFNITKLGMWLPILMTKQKLHEVWASESCTQVVLVAMLIMISRYEMFLKRCTADSTWLFPLVFTAMLELDKKNQA